MEGLSDNEKRYLLNLCRASIESKISGKKDKLEELLYEIDKFENLKNKRGCFVTLNKIVKEEVGGKDHELRGCIGYIEPIKPLYQCVIENAINAAFNDLRFLPVDEDELKDIDIEISILSVPKKLIYRDEKDLFEKLIPLKHGVILRQYDRSATFLPQVWEEFKINDNYDKKSFLKSLCLKANLYSECWKNKPDIYVYSAYVFSENELKRNNKKD